MSGDIGDIIEEPKRRGVITDNIEKIGTWLLNRNLEISWGNQHKYFNLDEYFYEGFTLDSLLRLKNIHLRERKTVIVKIRDELKKHGIPWDVLVQVLPVIEKHLKEEKDERNKN